MLHILLSFNHNFLIEFLKFNSWWILRNYPIWYCLPSCPCIQYTILSMTSHIITLTFMVSPYLNIQIKNSTRSEIHGIQLSSEVTCSTNLDLLEHSYNKLFLRHKVADQDWHNHDSSHLRDQWRTSFLALYDEQNMKKLIETQLFHHNCIFLPPKFNLRRRHRNHSLPRNRLNLQYQEHQAWVRLLLVVEAVAWAAFQVDVADYKIDSYHFE